MVESTCLTMRFTFSSAHRVRFSAVYGGVHGHNYDVAVRLCVGGRRDLVVDIDSVRREVQSVVNSFEGKYLKSTGEQVPWLSPSEYVEIPCMPEGVTGECLAWHLLDFIRNALGRLGIRDVVEVEVVVCDSPINCFEARSS